MLRVDAIVEGLRGGDALVKGLGSGGAAEGLGGGVAVAGAGAVERRMLCCARRAREVEAFGAAV